jgi:uncharacterized protein with ParB-like and HNH nuclease domain
MTVAVASCSLEQIFNSQPIVASDGNDNFTIHGQLTIPEYQRPYRWTEVQIESLLKDYQYYLDDIAVNNADYCYYLGSVILHQSEGSACLNIIDGQQRLTTLALIAHVQSMQNDQQFDLSLTYDSPESQQQIMHNLAWLEDKQSNMPNKLAHFDINKINLTLVVTRSEDDAYRFFETQNTGGVRLSGPDIIKAHHLRAVDRGKQNEFAKKWEALGDLNPVVGALLKGRYWQKLNNREVPSHRQPHRVRNIVVKELGESTGKGDDIAFGRFERVYLQDGGQVDKQAQQGYEMRQPLNGGINTIHYLTYFEELRAKYLTTDVKALQSGVQLSSFHHFYQQLICKLDGCSYLKGLYDSCLLLYISQFGEQQLDIAAIKLFRVVYSARVSNQKAVRETSISAFVRENPVLDWIAVSYTPQMCFDYLNLFKLSVDPANLTPEKPSVKKRFVFRVLRYFNITVDDDLTAEMLATEFAKHLNHVILSVNLRNITEDKEVKHA